MTRGRNAVEIGPIPRILAGQGATRIGRQNAGHDAVAGCICLSRWLVMRESGRDAAPEVKMGIAKSHCRSWGPGMVLVRK